jgi:hypothetical protein
MVSGPLESTSKNIFNELLQISVGLSLLFLAGNVSYNALKSYYKDLMDLFTDLLYKVGVWLFFTFGGLVTYSYLAILVNTLIYEIISPYLLLLVQEIYNGVGLFVDLGFLGNLVPFGYGRSLGDLVANLYSASIFFSMLVTIRYFLILAIIALTPIWAALWLFEWTRKIANMLIDVLVGLILAGLLNTVMLTLVIASGATYILVLLPLLVFLGTIFSVMASLLVIKPHLRLGGK